MILAIHGSNGSGKSTLAGILHNLLVEDERYIRKSFSTAVNTCFKAIYGIDYSSLPRDEKELIRPDFVEFAETMKRYYGTDVWVNAMFSNSGDDELFWIVDDLRFLNEATTLLTRHDTPCKFIELIKPGVRNNLNMLKYDYSIVNDKSMASLFMEARKILLDCNLIN